MCIFVPVGMYVFLSFSFFLSLSFFYFFFIFMRMCRRVCKCSHAFFEACRDKITITFDLMHEVDICGQLYFLKIEELNENDLPSVEVLNGAFNIFNSNTTEAIITRQF